MSYQQQSWVIDILRDISGFLDKLVYGAIKYVLYGIFDLAGLTSNSNVFDGIYQRIYVILGIFMAFKLTFSFFQYIINPDTMDSKNEKGLSKLIQRVFIMLFALVLLPTFLFGGGDNQGILKRAQDAFLPVLPRLIFGTDSVGGLRAGQSIGSGDSQVLETSSDEISSSILGGFFMPVKDIDLVCGEGTYDSIPKIESLDDFNQNLKITCNKGIAIRNVIGTLFYKYSYMMFISTIVGVLVLVMLLGITLDIAKRVFKLIILEIIAPIPIMSLIDPKGSKDGAFSKWIHSLISTFLDIFIKLGLVYLIIVLIHMIVNSGSEGGLFSNWPQDDSFRGTYLTVLLIIGLIFFAKEAPKFIKDALGIKDSGGGLFDDVKSIGKAASFVGGAAAIGVGTIGSMATNFRAAKEESKELLPHDDTKSAAWNAGMATVRGLRNVGSALAGAISGGAVGTKALFGKDGGYGKVRQAMDARNAARASHKTGLGSLASSAYGLVTGDSLASRGNKTLEAAKAFVTAQGNWKKALETEAIRNGAAITWTKADGTTFQATYREVQNAMQNKKADEDAVLANGTTFRVGDFDAMTMEEQLKAQVLDYQSGNCTGNPDKTSYKTLTSPGQKLYGVREDVKKAASDLQIPAYDPSRNDPYKGYDIDNNGTFGASIGYANRIRSQQENSMRQRMRRANEKKK